MAIIGNALSVLALKAKIHVTTMPWSTVTFSGGGASATATADGNGYCMVEVMIPNFGTWTVTATNGNASGSSTVSVTDIVDYYTTVTMYLWFVQNGNFAGWVGHKVVDSRPQNRSRFADDGNYIWLTTDYQKQIQNVYVSGYFTNAIDMTYWNTMYIYSNERGASNRAGLVTDTSLSQASFTNSVQLRGQAEDYRANPTTKSLDVSGVTGNRYVGLRTEGWWSSAVQEGSYGSIQIYNLWLQR